VSETGFPAGTVPVVRSDGVMVGVAPQDVDGVMYRPASPGEVSAFALKQHYDTLGQTAGAFGEGALGTLLPVVGPAVERMLGVSAEDQLARAQFHPIARGLGGAAGAIAGSMTGVGMPGLATKLGAGVATGLGGGILGATAEGALQGALYSGSDVANRAVLRDPRLTAEAMLREVGVSTVIGGGFGALSGLARKFAADHAEQWAGDLKDFSADRVNKVLGGIQSDRARLVKKYGEEGYIDRMQGIADLLQPGPFDTSKSLYDKADKALQDAWGSMQGEIDKAGQAGAAISGDDLIQKFRSTIAAVQQNPFIPKATVARLDDLVGNLETTFGGKPVSVDAAHQLRKFLSQSIGYSRGAIDFDSNVAKGALHDWRGMLSDSIGDALDKSGVGSAAWNTANRQYHLASIAQDLAQRGINRAEGNNLVSLTELLTGGVTALGGAGEAGISQILGRGILGTAGAALLRRQGSNMLAWLGMRGSQYFEHLASGIDDEVAQAVGRAFSGLGGVAAQKAGSYFTPQNYAARAATLNARLVDQQGFLTSLQDPEIDRLAKPVADQMRERAVAAATTLGSELPRFEQAGPLDPQYQPSGSELAKLNRVQSVVEEPLAILAHISDGTVTSRQVGALDAVWPAYGQLIRLKALERLADAMSKNEPVPPRLRSGLAVLLGRDLSRATTGQAIAAAQASYATRQQQASAQGGPGGPGSGPRTRAVQTKIGQRFATATQAARENLEGRA
jgi:hypothetical protein